MLKTKHYHKTFNGQCPQVKVEYEDHLLRVEGAVDGAAEGAPIQLLTVV